MATRKRDRAVAIVVVIFFVMTSFGLSLILIWQESSNNGNSTTTGTVGTDLAGFKPVPNVTQLKVTDLQKGTGKAVDENSTVSVYYTGAIAATGVIFSSTDSSGTDTPASFALNEVITGWRIGMIGMKVGGVRQLLIPADLAYGADPPSGSGIPPNAALVFDVTLLSVSK